MSRPEVITELQKGKLVSTHYVGTNGPIEIKKVPVYAHKLPIPEWAVEYYPEHQRSNFIATVIPESVIKRVNNNSIISVKQDANKRRMTLEQRFIEITKRKGMTHIIILAAPFHVQHPDAAYELSSDIRRALINNNYISLLVGNARINFWNIIKRSYNETIITNTVTFKDRHGISTTINVEEPIPTNILHNDLSFWPAINKEMEQLDQYKNSLSKFWKSNEDAQDKHYTQFNFNHANGSRKRPLPKGNLAAYDLQDQHEYIQRVLAPYHELQPNYIKCKCGNIQHLMSMSTTWRLYREETNYCEICSADLGTVLEEEFMSTDLMDEIYEG